MIKQTPSLVQAALTDTTDGHVPMDFTSGTAEANP